MVSGKLVDPDLAYHLRFDGFAVVERRQAGLPRGPGWHKFFGILVFFNAHRL